MPIHIAEQLQEVLSPEAICLVELILQLFPAAVKQQMLGVNHWLFAVLECQAPMAETMGQGIDAAKLHAQLTDQLAAGIGGTLLPISKLVEMALERAEATGQSRANERDCVATVLQLAGFTLHDESNTFYLPLSAIRPDAISALDTGQVTASTASVSDTQKSAQKSLTPTLDKLGWDLTAAARDGKLSTIVERDEEMQAIIETLCRRTKRNPALIGPAGVGKTAIIEGLARRIVENRVPGLMQDARLISLPASAMAAGCSHVGDLEERMKAVLGEARRQGIILFIDEVHAIIGAGASGSNPGGDVATLLKPALARGDIACITATTDDEYRRFIEADTALERRFQPIRIQELSPEKTLQVLKVLRDELCALRDVTVSDEILHRLIEFAGQYLQNRHFPDKAVDLLEQCVAYVVTHGKHSINEADATAVVERMIGMPCQLNQRLDTLYEQLYRKGLLLPRERELLYNRLEITMRGLDLRVERPNAVLLLAGEAAGISGELSDVLAATLFGTSDRCVTIDCSAFNRPDDATMLLGAKPGFIGYSDRLPLHDVLQMPWCVVRLENIHACHPYFHGVIEDALEMGFFTLSNGKRVYLSDTIVILTMKTGPNGGHTLGFRTGGRTGESDADEEEQALTKFVSATLFRQIDLISHCGTAADCDLASWINSTLLEPLATKCRKHGLHLHFDSSFLNWLYAQADVMEDSRDWERLLDERVTPLVVPLLKGATAGNSREATLSVDGDHIVII